MGRLLISLLCALCLLDSASADIELKGGDVVAFVGGTDLVRLQKAGNVEAALTHQFFDAKPKFRDLAWDGDTVYHQSAIEERWRKQAFGDWQAQLDRVGATVVIAQFGKIESLDGIDALEGFEKAYDELIERLSTSGRRVVLLAPSESEWETADFTALQSYSNAVEAISKRRALPYTTVEELIAMGGGVPEVLLAGVAEKWRLWYEYWRPTNWKCLFGDDSERAFSNAAEGLPSFKEEWETYPALIAEAEARIFAGEAPAPKPKANLTGSREANIENELAAFEVLEGFEIHLFADESDGISNPLSVRWDPAGAMYVACSDTYPQVEPGVVAKDRVVVLHDKNGDGRADESHDFARGFRIPTGMEIGAAGVYIGHGTELVQVSAQGYQVLLSGFGNGDSHQTSNSFVWGPAGDLWWCQGDGIESRVETPFGISSLYQAGVFRLRPSSLKLDGLLDDFMGPGNPWGIAFDDFGQSFVIDGAGGISYLTPGSIPVKRRRPLPRIGKPGGYCGIDCLGARTFPDGMQGQFVIGDYKKNQVSRFATIEDGAGFKVEFKEPLLRSSHRNFRPIDVKVGPDGAIYVVDWYNPITCHQDDFYRHPNRDKTHGRIWRVARKAIRTDEDGIAVNHRPFTAPKLAEMGVPELLRALQYPERWTRLKAKQILASGDPFEVLYEAEAWAKKAKGRSLMEAVSLFEWLEAPNEALIERLLTSADHRGRAYAARSLGRWGLRLERPYELLQLAAADEHPRVRMEAVLAAAQVPDPRSALIAAAVAERPMDRWVEYAFAQAVHYLKPHWVPAFQRGELNFGDGRGLAAVLSQADSEGLLGEARRMVREGEVEGDARAALVRALMVAGAEEGDARLVLEADRPDAELLEKLLDWARPGFEVEAALRRIIGGGDIESAALAIRLVGRWRVEGLYGLVMTNVESAKLVEPSVRGAALGALLEIKPKRGAGEAARRLWRSHRSSEIEAVLRAVVAREGAGAAVARELEGIEVFSMMQGQRVRMVWVGSGLVDKELGRVLDRLAEFDTGDWEFSDERVAQMVVAGRQGDAGNGAKPVRVRETGLRRVPPRWRQRRGDWPRPVGGRKRRACRAHRDRGAVAGKAGQGGATLYVATPKRMVRSFRATSRRAEMRNSFWCATSLLERRMNSAPTQS